MLVENQNHDQNQAANPFCHAGMTCHDGCRCASKDGVCHCRMLTDDKCACNGYCGAAK